MLKFLLPLNLSKRFKMPMLLQERLKMSLDSGIKAVYIRAPNRISGLWIEFKNFDEMTPSFWEPWVTYAFTKLYAWCLDWLLQKPYRNEGKFFEHKKSLDTKFFSDVPKIWSTNSNSRYIWNEIVLEKPLFFKRTRRFKVEIQSELIALMEIFLE